MIEFTTVCKVDEIPDGQCQSFDVGDRSIAVCNNNGKFTAIDDMCPHMGASLAEGDFNPETCNLVCPWHGWRFNVNDGSWADNPRIKTDVFEVRIVDGNVQIGIESKIEKDEQENLTPDNFTDSENES